MKEKIEKIIREVLKNLGIEDASFIVEHPEDFRNGDYSTNVALSCAKQLKLNPKELAIQIKTRLEMNLPEEVASIEIAGPGFINFYLSREFFEKSIKEILDRKENWGKNEILSGKKVLVEYTQPNPFKPFHIGHLMSNAIGESISRIVEFSGAKTIRANYQGDVGPHVAKAIYGLLKFGMPDENLSVGEKAQYIGNLYAKGNDFYETDEEAKKEIDEINKKVYERSDEKINEVYDWGRKITLEAFEEIYKLLGTKFDDYFFESDMAKIGEKVVVNNPDIFKKSDGAVVFHAEEYDPKLHTRVFINSKGLVTYESKEIGLTIEKFGKYNPDISIVTTAIEQAEYMKVVQKAISLIHPDFALRMKHITHGMMRLASGKMSSRKGNVVTGESLLRDSMDVVLEKMSDDREFSSEEKKKISEVVGVSALKYSILKSSLGSDIIYDFEKSISFDGDSGPYLQYTAVRANAILNKSKNFDFTNKTKIPENTSDLEKLLYKLPETISYSYKNLETHHIAVYLTQLASAFNTFYGNTIILQEENESMKYHLDLVKAFYQTMKNGLWLLGIEIPEKM